MLESYDSTIALRSNGNQALANLLVFYIVDGLKGDLIICFKVLTLLCKDHENIHAALN